MRNVLIAAAVGLITLVGCKHNDNDMDHHHSDTKKMSSMHDDCPHCPGQQTARADGTCPECGMKVK